MHVGHHECPDCGARYAATHFNGCRFAGLDPQDIPSPIAATTSAAPVNGWLVHRALHRFAVALSAFAIAVNSRALWEAGGALELWCDERLT